MASVPGTRREFLKGLGLGAAMLAAPRLAHGIASPDQKPRRRPNIILIMTDDSGYSDLGCYGGEIPTPNIDALAREGMRFSRFYTNARCSPTRASLLTGRDCAHGGFAAGTLGGWKRELNRPAYRARLNQQIPTLAELLKGAGYHTLMSGKWHLGGGIIERGKPSERQWHNSHPEHQGWELTDEEIQAEYNGLPLQRGFDRFFGLLPGETHFFVTDPTNHPYTEGNERAVLDLSRTYTLDCHFTKNEGYPYVAENGRTMNAWYSTDGCTDKALEMIEEVRAADPVTDSGQARPFFLYLPYQAPHHPLQAPKKAVDKYMRLYEAADIQALQDKRVGRLVEEGLLPSGTGYMSRASENPFAATPRKRQNYIRTLAIHAAMTEIVDRNVGRIIAQLKAMGEYDNTVIFYLSDNGAAGGSLGILGNTPYRGCKALLWEGGSLTHMIARWPGIVPADSVSHSVGWVGDFVPTCLEIAGCDYPSEFKGNALDSIEGRSLMAALRGRKMPPPEYLFWNDMGQQSVLYQGRWKLIIEGGWYVHTSKEPGLALELYDLENDPTELTNVADGHPQLVAQLQRECDAWRKRCGIVPQDEYLRMVEDKKRPG